MRLSAAATSLNAMTDPGIAFPRFIYVPWSGEQSPEQRGHQIVNLAHALAQRTGHPLLGIAATKNQLPDDWGKLPYRTRKSSSASVSGPAVEIHFWPSLDTLAYLSPARAGYAFVLEWGSDDLSGWARHHHAIDFDTKEELAPAISDEAAGLYAQIDRNGNNSWHDDYGERGALRDLRRLRELGELDPDDLAGYMIGRHSNSAIRRLLDLARRA